MPQNVRVGLVATATILTLNYCAPIDSDRIFHDNTNQQDVPNINPVELLPHKDAPGPGDLCFEDDECWDCHADGNGICTTEIGG